MEAQVHGIHHVTAISGDAQENLDFYVGVLGLRLVKRSVNQDDPGTYHLFYADGVGTPGTDLTFFPWPRLARTRVGAGLTVEVSFGVPEGALAYWKERLEQYGVAQKATEARFGDTVLPFTDPHGLPLALVETTDEREWIPWEESPVPVEHQLRGFHSVRLRERDLEMTSALLTRFMGFSHVGSENGWERYGVDGGRSGNIIDLKAFPGDRQGQPGVGGIHHVAWRVRDTEEEMALRDALQQVGLQPTTQIDRFWFKSVYFREPGGALFELATDGPGFDRDEALETLGEQLILPPWLEPHRQQIEQALPPLRMPTTT